MKYNQIANEIDVSPSYLSMVLSGKRKISAEIAHKLEPYRSQLPVKFRHILTIAKEEVASSNLVFRSISNDHKLRDFVQ
jgi:hypothetical protein